MGGRGASSGVSDKGKKYGTEYSTVYQSGTIKFVKANVGAAAAPLETMTKGRIYATVSKNGKGIKSISFYDRKNRRFKQIDLDHYHRINGKAQKPHVQYGYYHDGKATTLSNRDTKLIDTVLKAWHNKK